MFITPDSNETRNKTKTKKMAQQIRRNLLYSDGLIFYLSLCNFLHLSAEG